MTISVPVRFDNIKFQSFAEAEKYVYSMGMEFARNVMKAMLEIRDLQILAERDAERYRCKGPRRTCIKTLMGEVECERRVYQDEAEAVFAETGVFVTAVMQPVRMLYRNEWGCPPEGEFGYALHGVRTPRFTGREAFLQALELLAERLKARLGQAAMHLEVAETELDYLTLDEKGADV